MSGTYSRISTLSEIPHPEKNVKQTAFETTQTPSAEDPALGQVKKFFPLAPVPAPH